MKLLFERSRAGRGSDLLPACDVPVVTYDQGLLRAEAPRLPEMAEVDLSRHYTELAKQTHGVNDGFYPLGSCTMKYNPRVNEEAAAQPGFTQLHPLQPVETVQGALEVIHTAEKMLCEITGMDSMTFQPAAGAHGEYTGLLLIRKYHQSRGGTARTKIDCAGLCPRHEPRFCHHGRLQSGLRALQRAGRRGPGRPAEGGRPRYRRPDADQPQHRGPVRP